MARPVRTPLVEERVVLFVLETWKATLSVLLDKVALTV
jgi:hypothetical protein